MRKESGINIIFTCIAGIILLMSGSSCSHTQTSNKKPLQQYAALAEHDPKQEEITKNLKDSIEFLSGSANNYERQIRVMNQAWSMGFRKNMELEDIQSLSNQKNILINIPGKNEEIVYIVAHYDASSTNPAYLLSRLFNGAFDQVAAATSNATGAVDNGSGVMLSLALANYIKEREGPLYNTYHILLCGGNKVGLKGSRSHVSMLSKQKLPAIELAINLDTLGSKYAYTGIDLTVSDENLSRKLLEMADQDGIPLQRIEEHSSKTSDFEPFKNNNFFFELGRGLRHNLIGGLVPQKTWFTESYSIPILYLTSSKKDKISPAVMPDTTDNVDEKRLYEVYWLMTRFIEKFDQDAIQREAVRKRKHEEYLERIKARETEGP